MTKKILFLIIVLSFIVLPTISAWGPNTHNQINLEILNENTTTIGEMCGANELNRQAYLLGSVTPDITVIYYYEEGGKNYRLTHNWNFQQELMSRAKTEDEQCFAWGVSAHLIQDGIAHTQAVPKAIKKYHVPNWLLHPLLEKKYDSAIALQHPELISSTPHMMDALDGPQGERYIELVEYALGENSQLDVKNELTKLRMALDSFYDAQFRPSGANWIFKAYPYIDKLTNFLAPSIGTMNFGDIEYYYEKAKEQTVSVFNNWGTRYQISPHGFTELSVANEESGIFFTIILLLAFGIPIFIVYLKRKTRRKWLYLLLIPIILILMVIILYASL